MLGVSALVSADMGFHLKCGDEHFLVLYLIVSLDGHFTLSFSLQFRISRYIHSNNRHKTTGKTAREEYFNEVAYINLKNKKIKFKKKVINICTDNE